MPQRATGLPTLLELARGAAASMARAKAEAERPPWPPNPFPKGIRPGSATEAVLLALTAAHPRLFEHWELTQITGRSRGAIAWALGYLAEHELVRSIPSSRHPQYLRYQAVVDKQEIREIANAASRD